MITSNSDGDYIVTSRKSVESEGNGEFSEGKFVAFDVFLRTSADKDLYLTNESQVKYNGEANSGVENAIRVAFVIEGHTGINDPLGAMHSLRTNSQNNVYIWEPNYDVHTEGGIKNAQKFYGLSLRETGGSLIPYVGINQEFTEEVPFGETKNSRYFTAMHPDITTTAGYDRNQDLMRIPAGVSKLRIYLWLEGEDVDFENKAAEGKLRLDLELAMSN